MTKKKPKAVIDEPAAKQVKELCAEVAAIINSLVYNTAKNDEKVNKNASLVLIEKEHVATASKLLMEAIESLDNHDE
jgi:hypothetical protein